MSNSYFDTITPDKLTEAKRKGKYEIASELRRAEVLRAVGGNLSGAYVTKRIEDKILAAIPGANRIYLHKRSYCDYIELAVYFREIATNENPVEVTICTAENRRIDGEKLLADAEKIEASARAKQANMAALDEAAEIYNSLAERYARIYEILDDFLYESIPYADYALKNRFQDLSIPERLSDPEAPQEAPEASAPVREPIPLPVRPVERFTMDEFIARAAGSET